MTRAGLGLVVQSITIENHPEGIAVYNFEVEDDHTYFVGKAQGGTWVHNNCDELIGTLNNIIRQKAGFSETGQPIILDTNRAMRGMADARRAAGKNVRSVPEIFSGADRGDPAILGLAKQIGARVLTADRGRQLGQGFGSCAISVRGNAQQQSALLRLLEEEGL